MVFVVSSTGICLMPTTQYKARRLLKKKRARIYKYKPFTIMILDRRTGDTQPVEYKCDTGYAHIGISICSEKHEYVSEQRDLLTDEVKKHDDCRKYRRGRRNHLRHRKPRFDNRRGMIVKDGFAPSIRNKRDRHIDIFKMYYDVVPITHAYFEMGQFDTQLLKAIAEGKPLPKGCDYQHGARYSIETLREAVFTRDHYTCGICKKNSFKDGAILRIHHVGYWKYDHTDRLSNLLSVCTDCHTSKNHQPGGKLYGLSPKLPNMSPVAFMTMVRFDMFRKLKESAPDVSFHMTYGAKTKLSRKGIGIKKSHANDAYAMGKFHPKHRADTLHYQKKRRNDRCIEKFRDATYVDIRNGEVKKGSALGCNRTNRKFQRRSPKNERIFRGQKVSDGSRAVRKQRYQIRPGYMVIYDGQIYKVHGTQNKGKTLSLETVKIVALSDLQSRRKNGTILPIEAGQKLALVGRKEKHEVLHVDGIHVVMRWYLGVKPDAVTVVEPPFKDKAWNLVK